MLHVCLPLDFTPGDPVRDAGALEDFTYHLARARAVAGAAADFAAWKLRSASGLTLSLNTPRRLRGTVTMVAKWRFLDEGHPCPWGGDIRFRLNTGPALVEDGRVLRAKVSKSASAAPADLVERDISLVAEAVTLLMEEISHDRPATESVAALLSLNTGLGAEAAITARECIEAHRAKDRAKASRSAALRDEVSALPDGTPIIIRRDASRSHGGAPTWQLGLKSGRADASLARNVMIAPDALLRGDELRAAGLSAHDALPLLAAAAKARAAHPGLSAFRTGKGDLSATAILHPGQPFHESFLATRRKIDPAAWMQTMTPPSTGIVYEVAGAEPHWPLTGLGHRAPGLPKVSSGPVSLAEKTRYGDRGPNRFARLAGLWCVPRDVADILETHEMGSITLRPLAIDGSGGAPLPGDWSYLAGDETVQAVDTERTDSDILKYNGGRTVQPFEVVLGPDTGGTRPDIWFDDTVRGGALFLSDRLYRALRRARALPAAALKPCRN